MRRRQDSPWLIAERNRVRTTPTQGIVSRLSEGENVFRVWREETTLTLRKLARLSGVDYDRLQLFEYGRALPHLEELEGLAKALRVAPDLLMPKMPEPTDGDAS